MSIEVEGRLPTDEEIAGIIRGATAEELARAHLIMLRAMEQDALEGSQADGGRALYGQLWGTLARLRGATGQRRDWREEAPGRVLAFPICHPVAGKGA